jgi:thymidylate synthase ThyX
MYDCKMLADSIAPNGARLCTQQVTAPRFILAEINTHRKFSRNSASSRAMPVEKNIERMLADPFVPAAFGSNKKGMQAGEELAADVQAEARAAWAEMIQAAAGLARVLAEIGVHKQWANRLIEFASWHTMIITCSDFRNWDALRDNPQASPEIQVMARMMKECRAASTPVPRAVGDWHLPLVRHHGEIVADTADGAELLRRFGPIIHDGVTWMTEADATLPIDKLVQLSVARCARVSYLTHDGKRDVDADLALYDRLVTSGHMSPLEHAAKVANAEEIEKYALFKWAAGLPNLVDEGNDRLGFVPVSIGNLDVPWLQHRKMIAGEDVFTPQAT